MPAIKKLMDEVLSGPTAGEELEGPLAEERKLVAQAKKLGLFAAGAATQKYMQAIQDQQEVMGAIADMMIEIYAMESAVLRAQKIVEKQGRSGRGACRGHDARLSVAGDGEDRIRPRRKSSPRSPKATCCARSWRFCAALASTNPSTRLSCVSRSPPK